MSQTLLQQYGELLAAKQMLDSCFAWYCHYCTCPLAPPGWHDRFTDAQDADYNWRVREIDGRKLLIGRMPATVDHRVPRSRGGTDDLVNLVLCCSTCNRMKGSRSPLDYEAILKEWMWRNRFELLLIHAGWNAYYIDHNIVLRRCGGWPWRSHVPFELVEA